MLGLKTFIFSLFICLSFSAPIDFKRVNTTIESQLEVTMSSLENDHQALIVENNFQISQANWSLKSFKLVYNYLSENSNSPKANSYDYKLLYLEIGNTIPLKLTARTIIFPFHFFT